MTSLLPDSHIKLGFVAASAFSSVGVILNTVTLITLINSRKLRAQPTNQFIISLTVSDLLYCAVCLPLTADTFNGCSAVCHNEVICKGYAYIFYAVITTMMLSQGAVAFNRFVTVCYPVNPPLRFNFVNNCLLIAFTWIFPLVVLLLPLTDFWGTMGYEPGTGTCTFTEENYDGSPRKVLLLTGLGLPTVVITYCYLRVFITFKKSSSNIKNKAKQWAKEESTRHVQPQASSHVEDAASAACGPNNKKDLGGSTRRVSEAVSAHVRKLEIRREKQENRMTLTLFLIFLSFIVCTAPPALILTVDPGAKSFPNLHIPFYIFGWAFGVVNPIMYFAFNKSYRDEFKAIILRCKRK